MEEPTEPINPYPDEHPNDIPNTNGDTVGDNIPNDIPNGGDESILPKEGEENEGKKDQDAPIITNVFEPLILNDNNPNPKAMEPTPETPEVITPEVIKEKKSKKDDKTPKKESDNTALMIAVGALLLGIALFMGYNYMVQKRKEKEEALLREQALNPNEPNYDDIQQ